MAMCPLMKPTGETQLYRARTSLMEASDVRHSSTRAPSPTARTADSGHVHGIRSAGRNPSLACSNDVEHGSQRENPVEYDDFRVVLTTLKAGARVPEHKTEGRISVHVLSGHIRMKASGRTFTFALAVCSRSIAACRMTSKHSKRARFSSRSHGLAEDDMSACPTTAPQAWSAGYDGR